MLQGCANLQWKVLEMCFGSAAWAMSCSVLDASCGLVMLNVCIFPAGRLMLSVLQKAAQGDQCLQSVFVM